MKITNSKDNFLQAMQIIQSSVASRTTLPVLHNFLVETTASKIKMVRTDLEMAVVHFMNTEIEEDGSVTIPTKEFSDILHNLPGNVDVTLVSDENNKIHVKCGKTKFQITGTAKEEYPLVPDMDKSSIIRIPAEVVQKMVQKTIFSASTQETRYVLNGILWIGGKNGLEMVATDGRRLAVAYNKEIKVAKDFRVIVPTKILQEVIRFISMVKPDSKEEIEVGVSPNQIGFRMKESTFISKLVEGNFPNYEQIIPAKKDVIFEVGVKDLLAITKRASLCISERGGAVKYTLKDGTLFVNSASQKMEFNDEMPLDYKGPEFQIAFNPQYVTDVLKNLETEKVKLGMTNSFNPALLEPSGTEDCRYVIMPVRM